MAEKIRIKDIAERAGVSVGTVDRVLHNRPNVSKPAREKVEKALKEMNYQPDEVAGVLGHEMAHGYNQHVARDAQKTIVASMLLLTPVCSATTSRLIPFALRMRPRLMAILCAR